MSYHKIPLFLTHVKKSKQVLLRSFSTDFQSLLKNSLLTMTMTNLFISTSGNVILATVIKNLILLATGYYQMFAKNSYLQLFRIRH